MRVRLEHVEDVGGNAKTFWFRPERRVRYVAGQFTELHLPHEADDRGIRRWFTLSSSPTEELVSITTRFADERSSTFKQKLANLQPGMELNLADPMGDFVLPKDTSIPLVFATAGLGITPVRSMIKWLADTNEQRDIQLLYADSTPDDLLFESLFRKYPLNYQPIIKRPPQNYGGESGSLTTERIIAALPTDNRTLVYISGPEPLVEKLYKELQAKGVSAERLIADYFPGYRAV
jgi:ferredoxin-NADP reductase